MAGSLTPTRVQETHERLALALERSGTADPEQLCEHWQAAGDHVRAANHARQAASRAALALAFERAEALYAKALLLGQWSAHEGCELRVLRAEALARAGRGAIAGAAYLEAIEGASESEAIDLKRRAAEQYVYSGDRAQGRALLEDALAQLGIRLPATRVGAIASLVLHQARLQLRGHRLRERATVSESDRRRLDALRGAGSALIRSDVLRGTDLLLRHLLLALEVGDVVEANRGLAWQVVGGAFMGIRPHRLRTLERRAEALCERTGDVESRAMLYLVADSPATTSRAPSKSSSTASHCSAAIRCRPRITTVLRPKCSAQSCEPSVAIYSPSRAHCPRISMKRGLAATFASCRCGLERSR